MPPPLEEGRRRRRSRRRQQHQWQGPPAATLLLLFLLLLINEITSFSSPTPPWNRKRKPRNNKKQNDDDDNLDGLLSNSPSSSSQSTTTTSNSNGNGGGPRMKPRLISASQAKTAREAAYLAALAAERDQSFISDALLEWSQAKQPSASEMALATLVANVACREAASLDFAIRELAASENKEQDTKKNDKAKQQKTRTKPIKLKARQRVVLRVALAQYKYCTRSPIYAIVDHSVEMAKKYGGGPPFASFTNALLRKLPQDDALLKKREGGEEEDVRPLPVPKGDSMEDLAARLSYPLFLVKLLVEEFGKEKACMIMAAGNCFPPTMVRSRSEDAGPPVLLSTQEEEEQEGEGEEGGGEDDLKKKTATTTTKIPWETIQALPPALTSPSSTLPYTLGIVRSEKLLRQLTKDSEWYVTNGTPAGLLARLAEGAHERILGGTSESSSSTSSPPPSPLKVLDVCAAPGGKGLAVHDIIQKGQGHPISLVMNDVSEDKTIRIRENLSKFGLEAQVRLTISDGATLTRAEAGGEAEEGFDLIILDVPCSNAGVLGRRPEARWRLEDATILKELEETQFSLLKNAKEELLSRNNPRGEIWYMTCSILGAEDEKMVQRACRELDLEVVMEMKVLPGEGGGGGAFDGGYAAALRRLRQ